MSDIKKRLDMLRKNIQEKDFLLGKGLSNEVNIRMFCYDANDEMIVQHFVEQLKTDQALNCRLIEVNLYETFLSICNDKRITNSIPAICFILRTQMVYRSVIHRRLLLIR